MVLHAHLPYVLHHGRFPHGTDWLCEAVAECYLPLLKVLRGLIRRGLLPRCTLEFSPVLCEQLAHPAFRVLFQQYCQEKMEAAREDEFHFRRYGYGEHWIRLAQLWQTWYAERLQEFLEEYRGDLIAAFARLQSIEVVELATSAATHAYLPLLPSERAVAFQLRVGVEAYRRHFGRTPQSVWLPECGYYPAQDTTAESLYGSRAQRSVGVEYWLWQLGLESCVVEQQLLERGHFWSRSERCRGPSLLQPYWCCSMPECPWGCYILARHQATAAHVWDARTGYPGDGDYLDFHKRHYTSWLRYWRVTDNRLDMQYKLLYVPDWAQGKAAGHATHFADVLTRTLAEESQRQGCFPVLCLPFDAELFGHWWFEGPLFLHFLWERVAADGAVELWSLRECRQRTQPVGQVRLPAGSWGKDAGHEPWIDPRVRWMWHFLAQAEERLQTLLRRFPTGVRSPLQERLLRQALRELLLMQSSDWMFQVVTGGAQEYAEQRFAFHAQDFERLCQLVEESSGRGELTPDEEKFVSAVEERDSVFPELSVEWWSQPL